MNILSLDTATKCGWAHTNGQSGVQDFNPRRGDSPGMRFIEFGAWLRRFLQAAPTDLIVYEQAGHHKSRAATHVCEGLIAQIEVVQAETVKAGSILELTNRAPGALKEFIRPDVKASKRNKPRMMQYVENNWPDVQLIDDNQADAILLLWFIMHELRITGTGWHARHRGWQPGK